MPPILKDIVGFLTDIGFSQDFFYNEWTVIQLVVILSTALISRIAANYLDDPIRERLRKIEGQRALLRFLVIFTRRLFWFLFAAQLWISYFILRGITWPSNSYLVRTIMGLVTAWFIISLLSRIIGNRLVSRVVAILAWTVAALYIVGLIPETRAVLENASFTLGSVHISLLSIVKSAILLTVLIWAAILASQFIANSISEYEDISPSVQVLLTKMTKIVLLSLAVLISLGAVGIDFTALAVFSGALGIGIGLGLQRIVANFLSGIILLLDKSIKPGDVIEIETVSGSTYGWVQHLGARYTAVRTRDGTETLIPNETFIEAPVTNWTHTNKAVRRKLPIGVSYDTDVEKAIELCLDSVTDVPRVLQVPKPVCLLKGFGDSSVDLELRFWINDPEGGVANVSSLVYLEVWKRFQEHKIEIPFPQRDLNIRSSIPIPIKNSRTKT